MRTSFRQSGFSAVEVVIVIAIVGLLCFAGYKVSSRQEDTADKSPNTTSQSATASDVPAATEVNSTDDLDKQIILLDQTDTSSSDDMAELDAQLQAF
jgi:prepilin-type N-terminal cleavage/methylation domain-containing protein